MEWPGLERNARQGKGSLVAGLGTEWNGLHRKAEDPSGTGKAWKGLERKAPQSRAPQRIPHGEAGNGEQGTGMDLNLTWF